MAYEIKNKGKEAEVWIYEEIGEGWFGGLSAKKFADDLKAMGKLDRITVRLNSPGGDVFDGVAIYNILKNNPARVVVNIDGLAASIASIIAMAGDEINMAGNAFMMIHRAWGITVGNSQDMAEMSETLEKLDGTLAGTYTKRTGLGWDKVSELMAAETWMNAQEALDYGFVDMVTEEIQLAAHFDLNKFKYRHNPFALVEGADKPGAVAEPDNKGEPLLPDLSCFDRITELGTNILERSK